MFHPNSLIRYISIKSVILTGFRRTQAIMLCKLHVSIGLQKFIFRDISDHSQDGSRFGAERRKKINNNKLSKL